MKKLFFFLCVLLMTSLFSSCIALPDAKGGRYTYALGDDEIEYTHPDGSKTTINQDGTVTRKR